jgi:hypothetical protein
MATKARKPAKTRKAKKLHGKSVGSIRPLSRTNLPPDGD